MFGFQPRSIILVFNIAASILLRHTCDFMKVIQRLKLKAKELKSEVQVLIIAYKDKRTPASAKILIGITAGYLLSPVDLIPDFIPVIGHLDDAVIISALVFAWESAKRIRAKKYIDEKGVKHYEIFGPLFFASTTAFAEKFDVLNDPNEVIIDFKESKIADMSAIDAVNKITERYYESK